METHEIIVRGTLEYLLEAGFSVVLERHKNHATRPYEELYIKVVNSDGNKSTTQIHALQGGLYVNNRTPTLKFELGSLVPYESPDLFEQVEKLINEEIARTCDIEQLEL